MNMVSLAFCSVATALNSVAAAYSIATGDWLVAYMNAAAVGICLPATILFMVVVLREDQR